MDARPNPLPEHEDSILDASAADDQQVIRLPTVAGLMYDTRAAEEAAAPELWAALADAVLNADSFDDGDGDGPPAGDTLAEVIDLNRWRE